MVKITAKAKAIGKRKVRTGSKSLSPQNRAATEQIAPDIAEAARKMEDGDINIENIPF